LVRKTTSVPETKKKEELSMKLLDDPKIPIARQNPRRSYHSHKPLNVAVKTGDEGMTPRSSIFAYPVPAKEEARSKDTRSPQGPALRLGVEGKKYL
jgi:hypothetical protein